MAAGGRERHDGSHSHSNSGDDSGSAGSGDSAGPSSPGTEAVELGAADLRSGSRQHSSGGADDLYGEEQELQRFLSGKQKRGRGTVGSRADMP
eukprot:4884982-Pyramimonas_sp.AAC.1